jgi:hypothetical protein
MSSSIDDWLADLQKECFPPEPSPSVRQTNSELCQIKEKILPHLPEPKQAIIRDVPVALLSLLTANAHAFKVPRMGCGVCFDYAFVGTMRAINTLIIYQGSLMLPTPDAASFLASAILAFAAPQKRTLRETPRGIFLVFDEAQAAAKDTHDPELLSLVETATYYQHLLLLSHEFSHILCGHLDDHRTVMRPVRTDDASEHLLELYKILRQDEQEADEKAAFLLCSVLPDGHLEHAYHFVDALFQFFSLVEAVWERQGLDLIETRPPAEIRRQMVDRVMSDKLGRPMEPGVYGYLFGASKAQLKIP